jgi:uncharacterized repeat protein (TIGR01451 family)
MTGAAYLARHCLCVVITAMLLCASVSSTQPVVRSYGDWPIQIEPNRGQAPPAFDYVAHADNSLVYIGSTSVILAPSSGDEEIYHLVLLGADRDARGTAIGDAASRVNYLLGSDRTRWLSLPTYSQVRYAQVYPGIDVLYYGHGKHIEYDFVVAPGADPSRIRMSIGTGSVRLTDAGDLVVKTASGDLHWSKPTLYQNLPAGRKEVSGQYVAGPQNTFSITAGDYDRSMPLYIDPEITYATYLGGSYTDQIWGAAVDAQGNAYVTGSTQSPDFPFTTRAAGFNGTHTFVTKYDVDGKVVYSTYIGGTDGDDGALGIAVDGSGSAYVVGTTYATNFPTTSNAFAPACTLTPSKTCLAAFMAKFTPDGAGLAYSTYISGGFNTEWSTAAWDEGHAIAVTSVGVAYVGGATQSAHFPTTPGTLQITFGGERDAWIMKIDTSRSGAASLLWSTYLGGPGTETLYSLAIDPAENVYVGGETFDGQFPVKNALISTPRGLRDGFVAKLNSAGNALVYATYVAGSDTDAVLGVAADSNGYAYATGQTKSVDFPIVNAAQPVMGGGAAWGQTTGDGFVTRITPSGDAFVYSTYLGGLSWDWGWSIAADANGNAFVTGMTDSAEFPIVSGAPQTWHGGNDHGFLTQLSPDGKITASTFIGTYAQGTTLAVDKSDNVIVAGTTTGSDFPTKNPAQSSYGGGDLDAFVVKVAPTSAGNADLSISAVATPDLNNGRVTYDITVSNAGPYNASGVVVRDILPAGAGLYSSTAPSDCFGVAAVCQVGSLAAGAQAHVIFVATLTDGKNLVNTATVAANDFDPNLSNNQVTTTVNYSTSDLRVSVAAGTNPAVVGTDLALTATVANMGPDTATGVIVTHTPPANVSVVSLPANCSGTAPIQCQIGSIAANSSATVTITERPSAASSLQEVFDARAPGSVDPDLTNNSGWLNIPVQTSTTADLSISANASPTPVALGTKLAFAITVANAGTGAASQVHVVMVDPSTLNYDSIGAGPWSCSHIRGQVDCTLSSLSAGSNSSFTVSYVVQYATPIMGSAQVSATETDPNPANNMVALYVNVSDFDVTTSTGSATVRAGQSASRADAS